MVDKTVLASRVAAIRDAVTRIRSVLPESAERFGGDRTLREVVVLNLFVALQECVSLAAHWLADEGLSVPPTYGEIFRTLGARGILPADLSDRLAAASGFRNLVADRYGALDWSRVYAIASGDLEDLLVFCEVVTRRAGD